MPAAAHAESAFAKPAASCVFISSIACDSDESAEQPIHQIIITDAATAAANLFLIFIIKGLFECKNRKLAQ